MSKNAYGVAIAPLSPIGIDEILDTTQPNTGPRKNSRTFISLDFEEKSSK